VNMPDYIGGIEADLPFDFFAGSDVV